MKALLASIEHWARLSTGKEGPREGVGPDFCALCEAFRVQDMGGIKCYECPVFKHTGKHACHGTPYYAALDAYCEDDKELFRKRAMEELEFLEMLANKPNQGVTNGQNDNV